MSKTNDTAKPEVNEAFCELAAQELDCVAGGWPGMSLGLIAAGGGVALGGVKGESVDSRHQWTIWD